MIIDEKGRLFGRINIIDLIVILVLVAAVGIGAYAKLGNKLAITGGDEETLVIKYYLEEVSDFVAKKVKVGDALLDDGTNVDLGVITAVEIGPSVSYATNSQGEIVRVSKEGYNSILITSKARGKKTPYGVEINKVKYGVGHSFVLRAGDAKLYLRVYDIEGSE